MTGTRTRTTGGITPCEPEADRVLPMFFSNTAERDCPYLPDRKERVLASFLAGLDARAVYDRLVLSGFRRSRDMVYRPSCTGCESCVPVRVPVEDFAASRSQRRVWRRNRDLVADIVEARATPEHHALFARYQQARHHGRGMSRMRFDDVRDMIENTPVDTRLVEIRDDEGQLVAAALADWLAHGLSCVYTFFEPGMSARSLGTFLILWHIVHARETGLPHVYLGYWIAACSAMSYKANFRPIEALTRDGWQRLETGTGVSSPAAVRATG